MGILYVYTSIPATDTENRINLPLYCYSSLEDKSHNSQQDAVSKNSFVYVTGYFVVI